MLTSHWQKVVISLGGLATLAGLVSSGASLQTPQKPSQKPKAEATSPPLSDLNEVGRTHFSSPAPVAMETESSCDQRGNMYVAYSTSTQEDPERYPIEKLSPDSHSAVSYVLPQTSDYPSWMRMRWDVNPWGKVYCIMRGFRHSPAQKGELPDYLVAQFKDDGTVDSLTKLEQPRDGFFNPWRFAAFAYGGFLITGKLATAPTQPQAMRPFTAVYDRGGRLLREVELSDYVSLAADSEAPAGVATQKGNSRDDLLKAMWGADQGKLVAAADGNVYSLRATVPPVVYKISANGIVLKELKLQFNSSGLSPIAMSLPEQGGALIEFARMSSRNPIEDSRYQTVLAMIDLETGEVTRAYRLPAEQVMATACVTPQGQFLFVGKGGTGNLDLVKFAAR